MPAGATPFNEQLLRRLERLTLNASRGLPGGLSGAHPSRRRLPGPTFADHRPYTAGDDPRYVDWNAYARLDHLQLKLGEAEQDVRVYVLLDCSASMDWGEGDSNKLQYARLLAAAIGYITLASADQLQIIPFGDGRAPVWGPASGRQRAISLLQYLQGLAAGGATSAPASLADIARGRRGGILVIASDLLHSDDLEAALAPFHPPRWQVLVLHLFHPAELEPDLRGDIELEDSETGAERALEVNRPGLELYTEAVERWCDELAQSFARRQIEYVRLATDMSLERAAVPYLRTRGVIQ